MKYYEITDKQLAEQVKVWFVGRCATEAAFLRLSRRVGASRTRFGVSGGFGIRSFAFIFNKEPDTKHWKRDTSKQFWLPKLSSNIGLLIAKEVQDLQRSDPSRGTLSLLFGLKDVPLKLVGIRRLGPSWIIEVGDDWTLSLTGLCRISDVDVEKLENSRKKP